MATITVTPGKVAPANLERMGRKGLWQRLREGKMAYVYIAPAAIVMAFITVYPMLFQIWMSFTTYSTKNLRASLGDILTNSSRAPSYTLNNYTDIFSGLTKYGLTNYDFWRLLTFNIVW